MRSYLASGAFGKRTPAQYWKEKKHNSIMWYSVFLWYEKHTGSFPRWLEYNFKIMDGWMDGWVGVCGWIDGYYFMQDFIPKCEIHLGLHSLRTFWVFILGYTLYKNQLRP